MDIEERKKQIIDKYGTEPTICYFYYLFNVVNFLGVSAEEIIRESFETIYKQGNEIIIGDHSSTDNTVELAEEYGFKIIDVEPISDAPCSVTKVWNKVIKESKSNFLVDLDIHMTYPKNMNDVCLGWLKNNDIKEKWLIMRGFTYSSDGSLSSASMEHNFARFYYKPYLLEARGLDERTNYHFINSGYDLNLMMDVYNLVVDNLVVEGMIHKPHTKPHRFGFSTKAFRKSRVYRNGLTSTIIESLKEDFDNGIKEVQNSYW